jgi:murein L,D-transpeptidase YcbB/YkuD
MAFAALFVSCKRNVKADEEGKFPIDSTKFDAFFEKHPDFKPYRDDIAALYRKHQYKYIWYDDEGRNAFAEVLYEKARQIETEGVPVPLPYHGELAALFEKDREKPAIGNELLISSMYFFYADKVYEGIDPQTSRQLGWFLPRERKSYVEYLEDLMKDDDLIKKDEEEHIALYFNLRKALKKYRDMKTQGVTVDGQGVSIDKRIRTIVVNMERCRWLSADVTDVTEYVAVNIPAYEMRYVKDGKTALESAVIVGEEANKTVVFSGKMSYLVFSPYWNVPKSIVSKEILPELEKDKDYLEKNNMEWYGKNIRQRPGDDNSLGLIKFMFPNSNNIYLHDTPAKSLFKKEDRALSHGCVRVQKARELARLILEDDPKWTPAKIDAAMHAGVEKEYALRRKIPVYIAYFTAVADADGNVTFYDDVYKRDDRLARMLYNG